MSGQVTFDAFVMFDGGEPVEGANAATRESLKGVLAETCENYSVDLILHIRTDSFPSFDEYPENVTEEIFNEVFEDMVDRADGERIEGSYEGKLGDMIDDYNYNHSDSAKERYVDRQIDEMRGK